jgi:C4-dicarboxylate-specific signal transduction histidine kinase
MLEERIRECLELKKGELQHKRIRCRVPDSETRVAVDPGELDSMLLNLIDNAAYWLGQMQDGEERELTFRLAASDHANRVRVFVRDTGPGIAEDIIEKVFTPGFTRKPDGIGMGLTVASELVAEYGGRMSVERNGRNGACFSFDLPLKKKQ